MIGGKITWAGARVYSDATYYYLDLTKMPNNSVNENPTNRIIDNKFYNICRLSLWTYVVMDGVTNING